MSTETELLPKPQEPNGNGGSRLPDTMLGGVSVRGWLVVMLTMTVCIISAAKAISNLTIIEEPLYSGFMIALGYYFGQKNK